MRRGPAHCSLGVVISCPVARCGSLGVVIQCAVARRVVSLGGISCAVARRGSQQSKACLLGTDVWLGLIPRSNSVHKLDNCLPVLRRWGAISDRPLPESWAAFRQANPSESFSIQNRDPELIQLLDGSASARLRADALAGILSPVAPNPEGRRQEALKAEANELFNRKDLNLTEQMRLSMLAPKAHEQWIKSHAARQNEASDPHAAAEQGRMQRVKMASRNGYAGRID